MLPTIDVAGTEREMGRQIGESVRDHIHAMRDEVLSNLSDATPPKGTGLTRVELRAEARSYMPLLWRDAPSVADELLGMSEGSGVDIEETYLMQVPFAGGGLLMGSKGWRDPTAALAQLSGPLAGGCTTYALGPDQTRDGHVYLGQTCDFFPRYKDHWIVVRKTPAAAPRQINATPAGILTWGNGFNEAGVGLEYNMLGYPDAKYGVTPFAIGRMMLDQPDIDRAVAVAVHPSRSSAWNWMLADRSGRIVNVETTAERHAIVDQQGGVLTHANCFLDCRFAEEDLSVQVLPESHMRTTRLRQRLELRAGDVDIDYVKHCYEDHTNFPASICRHPRPGAPENETTDSNVLVISDLTAGRLFVCPGPICENDLVEYGLTNDHEGDNT